MKLAILKERAPGETRVAVTPEMVRKYHALGVQVVMEAGAGEASGFSDNIMREAGVEIKQDAESVCREADLLAKIQLSGSGFSEASFLKKGAILLGLLYPYQQPEALDGLVSQGISALALELLPRITRAQSMDVLSSQSNLAGYRAVLEALSHSSKVVPMFMTAAGTVAPARITILGAGVAGLQAIATAKRLGGIVSAFDVRPAVKEQVESLGATFIDVPAENSTHAETSGGYAKEMSEAYKQRQQQVIKETLSKQDIVITTALIPGKKAPILIPEDTVKGMKPGSVIVDMAVASGGNCPLSELGKKITKYGVTIVGPENLAASVALDASKLFARNIYNVVELLVNKETKQFDANTTDEIIQAMLVTHHGENRWRAKQVAA